MSTENSNASGLDFLWKNLEEPVTVKLPEGGGVYGFAGEWMASIVFRFWSDQKLEDYGQTYDAKRSNDNGTFYYFHSHEAASKAGEAVGEKYPPNTVWRWEIPTANIVNILDDTTRAKFGDVMSQEVSVVTLMSKKSRHELHMLMLPSAVQSLALLGGMIDHKIFDYESLRVDSEMIDDAYQAQMIGNGDGYEKSELWQARARIWEALGETNPKLYTVNQGKFDVSAPKLRSCLNIVYRPTNVFARLVGVPDPRVDAMTKAEKRLQVPVVAQVWRDRESMIADLDLEEKVRVDINTGQVVATNGASNGASSNGLHVPAAWAGYVDDWKTYVRTVIKPFAGKPQPIIIAELRKMDKTLQETYSASAEEFIAWLGEV